MMKIRNKKSSRTIKRALAFVMSFALAMSTLAVAPNADAAKKKTPKLSVKKKTLYYNKAGKKTYTLKVKKNKVKKIKKTTWKTSKKSVVAISSKKNTSVKLTAKKAGKAKITATVKYTVKGSKKVQTKKLICTVTSKKAAVATATPKATATATATAGATATATATATTPAEPTSTAPTEPTATAPTEPTATAGPTQTPVVGDVANVSAIITNSVAGYENTVLAGQDATIQVLVTDSNGNPVPNDSVVLTFDADSNAVPVKEYQIQSLKVAATNSKGIATFVVGANGSNVKNTDSDYLGTYDFKVTDASANISAKGKLKVATMSYTSKKTYAKLNSWTESSADVLCLNGNEDYEDLAVGTNSTKYGTKPTIGSGYASITKNTNNKDVQYVGSQQASTTNADHKVAFKTGVYLNIPTESKDEVAATSHVQTINKKSDKYGTYTSKIEIVNYDIDDLSKVSYATLAFNSLTLSKYTKLTVGTVDQYNNELDVINTYGSNDVAFDQKNFALQISKDKLQAKGAKGIYVKLVSEGQVNTDNNDGFDVKDLTYVYKKQETVAAKTVALDSASVKWEIVNPVYTAETEVTAEVKALVESEANAQYKSVKASIPVYPYAGNAIIKCYDANNNVKKYFACGTRNNGANTNVLDENIDLYEISEAEATNSVGTLTENNGVAEVDSTVSGTTYLRGTIVCSDENVKLDADCDTVYTSVMWNPVAAKAANDVRDMFMALEGQTITLKAQLVDDNGNAVATSGKNISWNKEGISADGDVNEILKETTTDAKGQATLKLSASKTNVYEYGITATEDSKAYNVVLKIGDKIVQKADLYWISFALQFTDKVDGTPIDTKLAGTANATAQPAVVGDNWEYAAKVIAYASSSITDVGALKDWNITGTVTGVVPTLTKSDDAVGTVALGTDGIAKVSSTVVGTGKIVNVLDANTKFDGAKVILTDKNQYWVTKEVTLVGEGIPAVDETLTINYSFAPKGVALKFVEPMGTKSSVTTKDIYLKVTDSQGNPLKDKKVKLSVDSAVASISEPTSSDANGIVKATISNVTLPANVTVNAKLLADDGVTEDTSVAPQSATYKFIADPKAFFVADNGVKFDSPNVVTLTLTEDVLATSVIKELFTVTHKDVASDGSDKDVHTYKIKSVAASGKKITITLDANFTIDDNDIIEVGIAEEKAKGGIAYSITSTTGQPFKADTIILQGNTVTSKNVADAAEADATTVTNMITKSGITYDEVKEAKAAYDELSTLALSKVTSENKELLRGYLAEVKNIDDAVNAVSGIMFKNKNDAGDANKVSDLTTAVNGVISGDKVSVTTTEDANVALGDERCFVPYTIESSTTATIEKDVNVPITFVFENVAQYHRVCNSKYIDSAATGKLNSYSKVRVTYVSDVTLGFGISKLNDGDQWIYGGIDNAPASSEDKVVEISLSQYYPHDKYKNGEHNAAEIDAKDVVLNVKPFSGTVSGTLTIKKIEFVKD